MASSSELTYTGLAVAVFANQICLPVPSLVFLMVAGALAADGKMRASMVVFLGVWACLSADAIWFWLGRRWGPQAMHVLSRFTSDPRKFSQNAHEKFRRHGARLLCVAKFVPGLDGLLPPLVGAEGVSFGSFLALDLVGAFLWSGFYTGLGYIFANQLDVAIGWAKQFGTVLGIAIAVPLVLYATWRGLALIRMIHRLKVRHISPAMLDRKLKARGKVAVLDLLNFEETDNSEAIPGAMRIEPSRLRKSPHLNVPDDVQIILYSSAGGDATSARAAMELQRIGVDNVWVLEGGLKGWRERGLPISTSIEEPEVVAQRFGIKLPQS